MPCLKEVEVEFNVEELEEVEGKVEGTGEGRGAEEEVEGTGEGRWRDEKGLEELEGEEEAELEGT